MRMRMGTPRLPRIPQLSRMPLSWRAPLARLSPRMQLAAIAGTALVLALIPVLFTLLPASGAPSAKDRVAGLGGSKGTSTTAVRATAAPTTAATVFDKGSMAGDVGVPASISVSWGDSTALVRWPAVTNASGYRVSLIRVSDLGIMEQSKVPASQLAFDAQGIWPGESYVAAVQALDAQGAAGGARLSAIGQSVPISRSAYNGFLDTMNLPQGAIDANLWDQRGYIAGVSQSAAFINNQIHGHIETGEIAYEQSMVGISARTPFDFTNRIGHIHGEVDLHGNLAEWFALVLAPRPIAANEMIDDVDRGGRNQVPMLELFNHTDGGIGYPTVQLLEVPTAGADSWSPDNVPVPDFSLVNVRNTVDVYVSTTHVKVLLDGKTAFDLNLPHPLSFSVGYLTLVAESYPKVENDETGSVSRCDEPGGECNVWHLDNWGFDAPASQSAMPALTVDRDPTCGPLATTPHEDPACDQQGLGSAPTSVHVQVADSSRTSAARLLFDAYRTIPAGSLQVSVNGAAWQTVQNLDDQGWGNQLLQVDVAPSLLRNGDNTVAFRMTQSSSDDPFIANVEIEQQRTFAFTPPALPPEPAPVGHWNAGGIP